MKLIVGLGNPGKQYDRTRHNLGRRLVHDIGRREKVSLSKNKKLQVSMASFTWEDKIMTVACPEVYMNLSGKVVGSLAQHFSVDVNHDLLVVVDDVALPFGRLRLRSRGSDGGHRGLQSIDKILGHSGYSRLRLGISQVQENGTSSQKGLPLEDQFADALFQSVSGRTAGFSSIDFTAKMK